VADEFKIQTDDLQAKLDAALTESTKVKDNLAKEQQAAIEAEEQCTKLEAMKSKLEDEISVSKTGGSATYKVSETRFL
jgi:predicted nuclease with TOPRIM domain